MFTDKISKSNKAVILALILGLASLFIACEDVIDLNVNEAEPQLVIEGVLIDQPPMAYFIISKSICPFEQVDIPMVSDAEVIITDNAGNVDTLLEYQPGVYVSTDIDTAVGRSYTATVTAEGITYTASSVMPEPIVIDSLTMEYQEGGGFGSDENEGYRLHLYFTDRENIDDFARIKLTQNDSLWEQFYLYDGFYSDSNVVDYEYFDDVFQLGDTIVIELYTMDETIYDYFRVLANVAIYEEGTESGDIPGNPETNWDNDVLGYFGVFGVRQMTHIVTDSD